MHIDRRFFIGFFVILALLPGLSAGQGLSGSVNGSVKDEQGGVLSGVTVIMASPAQMGGDQRTTANDKGQWRFPVLTPGVYVLTIDGAPGFAAYREEAITVGAGATIERPVVLKLASLTQSVTVTAGSSVESRSSGLETRFGPDHLETVPTRRFSMFDAIRSAPGMSPTSPSSGTVNTVSSFGSGVNENAFLIDGTNFTCPCSGVSRAEPSVDVIQEVHVQSTGASVEFGNSQGAVINVITKQGSNRFVSDSGYYGQASGLTAQPVVLPVTNGTQPASGYERVRYSDFSTGLGGPINRDRLWFYGAYQHLRDYDSQPGADPAFPRTYKQDKVFGKLTWHVTPALQMMQSFHQEFWENPDPPTLATPFETTLRRHATVPSSTFANVTYAPSGKSVWDLRIGRFLFDEQDDPSTGNRTTPNHRDQITGISSGNVREMGGLKLDRITAKAVLNRYQEDWLGAAHDFRAGVQIERGEHRAPTVIPGGVRYIENSGAPFSAEYRDPSIAGGRADIFALFASDALTLNDRLTVNAGIRFDHSRASSQDVPKLDASGAETDETIAGLGRLYTWNVVSPRLGLTAKLTADGRTMLRASYGRFNQGVLTGELSPVHPGVTPTTTMAFDQATGGYTQLVSVLDPKRNLALDPQTRTPRTDEYSAGVERQFSARLTASAAYIRKTGADFIAWTDTAGVYAEETRTVGGYTVPVFVLTNATRDRRFRLTNPADYSMDYHGMVVAVDRRLSNGWQASGSYTFSRVGGLQAASAATADGAQLSTVAPASLFGSDPNNLTNAAGRLPNDRPHVLRMTGSVQVPRIGVLVAANLQYYSGKPWAATAQVSLPQGAQRILLEERGSRRLSSQSILDLRVSKMLRFGEATRVELLLDVLNLFDDTAEEALVSDVLVSSTFGAPRSFVDPRRAMVGVRLHLGR
jgi:TonB-dependent receptor-like protein/carboxypeptidase family protein